MKAPLNQDHPLYTLFWESVQGAVDRYVATHGQDEISAYLTRLLVTFVHTDAIFKIKNREGQTLVSIAEMMAEGDIRANADSFERERQVHQHIADVILFWQGVYPQFLNRVRLSNAADLVCDYPKQARQSYQLVASYEEHKNSPDAATYYQLAEGFDDYAFCLRVVRENLLLIPGGSS
ncbi:MAG: hypothetical protein JNM85_03385 [Chthonomonas sp.]|nr:hypothetical protein [Chthonomonas sp.]